MIEPNRLQLPGERAARERVEVVFAVIDRLGGAGLAGITIPARDRGERDALIADLERAADARGLGPLLDEARGAVRDALMARFVEDLPAGTYVARAQDGGRSADRVALVTAVEDVVAVAVAEDVVEPDVATRLSEPGRAILGLPPLGRDAGRRERPQRRSEEEPDDQSHRPAWTPTTRDWQEAARDAHESRSDDLLPGVRGLWITFVAVAGISAAIATLWWGFGAGEPLVGLLGALAVVAVAWTLATFRRAR